MSYKFHSRALSRSFSMVAVSTAAMVAAAGFAGTAHAQDSEGGGLGEIVVTAQRYEQKLQDTPISIVAVDADSLTSMGVESLAGFDTFVPNVSIGGTVGVGNAVANFSIRGIGGAPNGSVAQESAVGVYIDDVLFARPNGALLDLLDIERMEVLRGPQGTLFGRNTAGGAIRYVTRKPSDKVEGNVRLTVGSYNRRDVSGVLNLPLGDIFAARVSFSSNDRQGHVTRIVDGGTLGDSNSQTARLQLRARPSSSLDINLSVDSIRSSDNGGATIITGYSAEDIFTGALYGASVPGGPPVNVAAVNQMRALVPASASPSNYCGQGPVLTTPVALSAIQTCLQNDLKYYYDQGGKYSVYGGLPDHNSFDSVGAALTIAYEVAPTVTFNSLSGYRRSTQEQFQDWDRTPLPIMHQGDTTEIEYFTQEFQLIGSAFDNRLKWQAGVFYYHDQADQYRRRFDPTGGANSSSEGTVGQGVREDKFITTESIAAYGQGTFEVTNRLNLTVGLRWTQDRKDFTSFRDDRGRVLVGGVLQSQAHGAKSSWRNFSPRFGIDYKWSDDIMTYASVAQGFKGGGFNDTVQSTCSTSPLPNCGISEYEEENLVTYELGWRSEFFDKHLRLNATYFHTKYSDQQINLIDMGPPALQYMVNGDSVVQGVEVDVQAAVTRGLVLRGSFGYVDAKYKEVMYGLSGQVSLTPDVPYFRSPKVSYSIGGNYTYERENGDKINFDLNYGFKDKQASFPNPTNMVMLPSYGLLNGRVEYEAGDGWTLALTGSNLTNTYYYTSAFDPGGPRSKPTPGVTGTYHDNLMGFTMADIGRPREVAVELRYKF